MSVATSAGTRAGRGILLSILGLLAWGAAVRGQEPPPHTVKPGDTWIGILAASPFDLGCADDIAVWWRLARDHRLDILRCRGRLCSLVPKDLAVPPRDLPQGYVYQVRLSVGEKLKLTIPRDLCSGGRPAAVPGSPGPAVHTGPGQPFIVHVLWDNDPTAPASDPGVTDRLRALIRRAIDALLGEPGQVADLEIEPYLIAEVTPPPGIPNPHCRLRLAVGPPQGPDGNGCVTLRGADRDPCKCLENKRHSASGGFHGRLRPLFGAAHRTARRDPSAPTPNCPPSPAQVDEDPLSHLYCSFRECGGSGVLTPQELYEYFAPGYAGGDDAVFTLGVDGLDEPWVKEGAPPARRYGLLVLWDCDGADLQPPPDDTPFSRLIRMLKQKQGGPYAEGQPLPCRPG